MGSYFEPRNDSSLIRVHPCLPIRVHPWAVFDADVLLIDDEPSILHAFRRAFREPEFNLVTASSAAEGLSALVRSRPDVVILDVHLGDATGLETFENVRRRDARTPVILITGHGTTDLAIEAIKRGAIRILAQAVGIAATCETWSTKHAYRAG